MIVLRKYYIFSPSAPNLNTSLKRRLRAIAFLEQKGNSVIEGDLINKSLGHVTGTIEERSLEFNKGFVSDADVIYASFGGENSSSILKYINYELIKKSKKIIVGNSDITAILLAIYAKTGLGSWHYMTLLPAFGEFEPLVSTNYRLFNKIVFSEKTNVLYKMPSEYTNDYINWNDFEKKKKMIMNDWIGLNNGQVKGTLLGGNLKTIVKLLGSEYYPNFDNCILLLEDSKTSPSEVESCLSSLINSGTISSIKGLIISKCENYQNSLGDYGDFVYTFFKSLNVPCFKNFDSGHTFPCMPVKIGGMYNLNVQEQNIQLILENKEI